MRELEELKVATRPKKSQLLEYSFAKSKDSMRVQTSGDFDEESDG